MIWTTVFTRESQASVSSKQIIRVQWFELLYYYWRRIISNTGAQITENLCLILSICKTVTPVKKNLKGLFSFQETALEGPKSSPQSGFKPAVISKPKEHSGWKLRTINLKLELELAV